MSSIAIDRSVPAAQITASGIFPTFAVNTMPVIVRAPGKLAVEQKVFSVRAEGSVYVPSGTGTALATLYVATALPANPMTPGSWQVLGAGAAQTPGVAGWTPFMIEALLQFESNSGTVQGAFRQMASNNIAAYAAISNRPTGVNATNLPVQQGASLIQPADPVLFFTVGMTLSAAGSIGNLMNFETAF